ncbi:hypothetical protein F2P56_001336 [Juglans regia]|uniref:Uncharacterized protein n=1 Tax=Juglans regia TaxID=51240 RepID=A0A833YEZ0_JUGRE|nr:hypothetical protein F2P56_001336 [Juglans regia]
MEVCNPKGGRTAALAFPAMLLLMMMITMLLNTYCCNAAVLAKSNTSFRCSDGRLHECLIEEDLELELGFLINPYVSRILGTSAPVQTENPDEPSVKTCGNLLHDNPAYSKCIAKYKPKPSECVRSTNSYKRC